MYYKSMKSAFSLVEILISLLIVSLLMVILAPVISKSVQPKKPEGAVFTYYPGNRTSEDNVCFTTDVSYDGNYTETYSSTRDCSEYTFTVPKGVSFVNLTLVAGGGGGGGAAGGTIENYAASTSESNSDDVILTNTNYFIPDLLRSVRINLLTGKGASGSGGEDNKGGKGGNSSSAIYDFDLPDDLMRGADYANTLQIPTPTAAEKLTLTRTDENAIVNLLGTLKYGVSGTGNPYCTYVSNGASYSAETTEFGTVCGVNPESFTLSVEGEAGESTDGTVYLNQVLSGGAGGKLPNYSGNYGAGGNGGSSTVSSCDYTNGCAASSAVYTNQTGADGGLPHASVSYSIERPGGAGGGGAAGTVIRIIGFPVAENETYTIRVGKGGNGGGAGFSSSSSPTGGENGGGGVSTAIYNSSGNLVFMVNGGAPGEGGSVYDETSSYTGDIGLSGRNYAKISYGTGYANYIKTDETLMTTLGAQGNNPDDSAGYSGTLALSYPALDDAPYSRLNLNDEDATDGRYGGFQDFDGYNDAPTYSGGKYNGFYFRTVINNNGAYVGGLGGFNGLGGKSGCGGYFLGNFEGRGQTNKSTGLTETATDTASTEYLNQFIISETSYNIFDYYDNCNARGSSGQTAEFVLPDPVKATFGQAGAGGGGGGWNVVNGAGNGGDGQNGYLMIDWRR